MPAMPAVNPGTAVVSAVPVTPPPADVAAMLAEISPQQLQGTLTQLVGFGTRHSPCHAATSATCRASCRDGASPSAETCRALASSFSPSDFDATLVFMVTAGEEQGLLGARGHAEAARRGGLQIAGVLSNDIVGDPSDPRGGADHRTQIRVFSEGLPVSLDAKELASARQVSALGEAPSRQLARHVAEVAAWQGLAVRPVLVFRPDRFLRGGDHLAFSELGFPAIRFTEVAEKYDRQHQEVRVVEGRQYGDRIEHVDG